MAVRENISVSFTPQQAAFLASCVASGRYQSTSEVVREALRLLQDQQARRLVELDRVRAMIREGAEELDRGDVIDHATFFRDWDQELLRIEAARRQPPE
jgi:antitoxin ParD1/3/4